MGHSGFSHQRTINRCDEVDLPCGWKEYVVGESENGHDIIDAVCPYCGHRVARREVVSNPDGDTYDH